MVVLTTQGWLSAALDHVMGSSLASGYGWMGNEEFVKKVNLSSIEGTNRREEPLGRWEDRVREYVSERGVRGNG